MRILFFLFVATLILPLIGKSQNWQPIKSNHTYITGDRDILADSTRARSYVMADSTSSNGDTIWLNKTWRAVEEITPRSSLRYRKIRNNPNGLCSYRTGPASWKYVFLMDTLRIDIPVSGSFLSNMRFTINQCTFSSRKQVETINGQADSVLVWVIYPPWPHVTPKTAKFSKEHGIRTFPNGTNLGFGFYYEKQAGAECVFVGKVLPPGIIPNINPHAAQWLHLNHGNILSYYGADHSLNQRRSNYWVERFIVDTAVVINQDSVVIYGSRKRYEQQATYPQIDTIFAGHETSDMHAHYSVTTNYLGDPIKDVRCPFKLSWFCFATGQYKTNYLFPETINGFVTRSYPRQFGASESFYREVALEINGSDTSLVTVKPGDDFIDFERDFPTGMFEFSYNAWRASNPARSDYSGYSNPGYFLTNIADTIDFPFIDHVLDVGPKYSPPQISILKNPFAEEIEVVSSKFQKYAIYNCIGSIIDSGILPIGRHSISANSYPPGLYVIICFDENKSVFFQRLIKK